MVIFMMFSSMLNLSSVSTSTRSILSIIKYKGISSKCYIVGNFQEVKLFITSKTNICNIHIVEFHSLPQHPKIFMLKLPDIQ